MPLIFPVQIEPRLDHDGATNAKRISVGSKAADFTSSIRSQFEAPFDAMGRLATARFRLETPRAEPGSLHMPGDVSRHFGTMKSRQRAIRMHTNCERSPARH